LGIGHWALGIGHWALGIGHWALVNSPASPASSAPPALFASSSLNFLLIVGNW